MAKLIFFLGNPGVEYKTTRHNAAWIVCEYLYENEPWKKKFNSLFFKKNDIVFVKPQTFMNKSGNSVSQFLSFFNVLIEDVLIVHDDVELKKGEIIFQRGGGEKGHNGLRSIGQQLGSKNYHRLRIGIGKPEHSNLASYVLGKFTEKEIDEIKDKMSEISNILNTFGGK